MAKHEPTFRPRYLAGSAFEPFPLNRASRRPWPKQLGTLRFNHISSVRFLKIEINESHEAAALKNSGGISFELLLFLRRTKVSRISSVDGALELISMDDVNFCSSATKSGGELISDGIVSGELGLKWDLKKEHNFSGSHAFERMGLCVLFCSPARAYNRSRSRVMAKSLIASASFL